MPDAAEVFELFPQGPLGGCAGQDVMKGIEQHLAPEAVHVGRGGAQRFRQRGAQCLQTQNAGLGLAIGGLYAQRAGIAAAQAEIQFASNDRELDFFSAKLGFHRREIPMQAGELDVHFRMRFRPHRDVIQLPPGRTATVIAESEGHKQMRHGFCGRGRKIRIETTWHFIALTAIPSGDITRGEHAPAIRTFPPEELRLVAAFRAAEGIGTQAVRTKNVRQKRRVAETIRRPADPRLAPEMSFEKRLPQFEMFVQRGCGGQVHVRLQERPADHIPATGFHMTLDGAKRGGIVALDFLVNE